MWTISLLKQNAWNSLKDYYWMAFVVCLLNMLIIGMVGGSSGMLHSPVVGMLMEEELLMDEVFGGEEALAIGAFMTMYFGILLFAIAISFLTSSFLGNPLVVGKCGFFRKARQGDVDFIHMFEGFSGSYLNSVKVMFLRMLYTFLWSLLFFVPGIIKSLEYTMIPYLMAENPELTADRAFAISKQTMNGEKGKLFVLQLSFIGWYLLGVLLCGLGVYFVLPYYEATMAEFYACMRAKAISRGITTEEELYAACVA
jgi:uncharacterized membrane protein